MLDDGDMTALVLIRHSVRFGYSPEADFFVTVDADGDAGRVEFGQFDRLVEAGYVETDGAVVRATERGTYWSDRWIRTYARRTRSTRT